MKSKIFSLWARLRSEDGAVTVDWVVLTAAVVAMGAVIGSTIWGDTGGISSRIAEYIGAQSVHTGL